MKTTLRTALTVATLSVGSISTAFASECTAEDLQAIAMEASTAMQSLAASNPAKMQEVAAKLQEIQTSATTANGDFSELCKQYEVLLSDIAE